MGQLQLKELLFKLEDAPKLLYDSISKIVEILETNNLSTMTIYQWSIAIPGTILKIKNEDLVASIKAKHPPTHSRRCIENQIIVGGNLFLDSLQLILYSFGTTRYWCCEAQLLFTTFID